MRKTSTLARAVTGAVTSAVVVLGLAPTVSAAEPLRCGDTVTTDVVLTENLTCSGDGLYVQGEGITINLNGHRLRGNGTGTGIVTSAEEEGLTITSGRVERFRIGVDSDSPQVRVHRVRLADNEIGLTTHLGAVITSSTFLNNVVGLAFTDPLVTVTDSLFAYNRSGISCGGSHVAVSGSKFRQNVTGIHASLCGTSVSTTTFIRGEVGMVLEPESDSTNIRNNTFDGAGVGIHLSHALEGTHVIADNEFTSNGASGLVIEKPDVAGYAPNIEVSGNVFKSNGFAPGSHVDPSGHPLTSGVWANDGAFARNQAIGNAGHGIEAYTPATDGGGNVARRNGAEPQCIGVVCTPR